MEQGLILNSQELSEFEREIANLGIAESGHGSDESGQLKNNGQLSLSEERAWMLHQQDPLSAAGPFTAAFRLLGKVDVACLAAALKELYQADSNLNLVYKLDDEGELIKEHSDAEAFDIEVLPLQSDEDVINFLLQRQNTPIDLASQMAVQFWLFPKPDDEVILGILGHHILLDDSAWKPILNSVSAFYNGVALPKAKGGVMSASPKKKQSQCEQYWLDNHSDGFHRTPFPSLFSKSGQLSNILHLGSASFVSLPTVASRFYTQITTEKAERLASEAQASPFQALLTLFGLYLNQLFDRASVDILIPVVDHQEVSSLSQIGSSSNVIPVRIENVQQSISSAIQSLRNGLLNGLSHNLPIEQIFSLTKTKRHASPNILVTQVDDASGYLTLDGVKVEGLAIPPLASDYDLTLAIQFEGSGQVKLELTTGAAISARIGSFLLEKFVDFVMQVEADNVKVFPSLFASGEESDATQIPTSRSKPASSTTDSSKQAIIAAILGEFSAVLEQKDITEESDFFELGGHSLLATRVIGKLKSHHNIEVKIADFFNAPTALELADFAQLSGEQLETVSELSKDEEIVVPHSYIQMTYMKLIEMGRNPIFNIPFALKFAEPVDEQAFYRAFCDTLVRHHALRSLILIDEQQEPLQRVIPASTIESYQWFFPSSMQGDARAEAVLAEEANYSFDLIHELPLRVRFLYNEKGEHFLSLLIYHTAFDEWSTGVLISDLFYAYKQYVAGKQPVWGKMPAQFHQFVLEQRQSSVMDEHLEYWKKYLGKVEPAKSLFHLENGMVEPSSEGDWLEFSFDKKITGQLNQLAKVNKSSMFHVVYAAFSLAMYYLGAGKKVLVGTSAYGRDDPRYQDTVGLFTNVLLNHVQFDEELYLNQLVTQVKDNIIASLPYSDVPFVTVEHAVAAQSMESATDNLCEVYIQYHQKNVLNTAIELEGGQRIDFEMLEPERNIAKFGLHFEAYEDPHAEETPFRVVLAYRKSHYSSEQIALVRDTTKAVVTALAASAELEEITLRDIRKQLAEGGL